MKNQPIAIILAAAVYLAAAFSSPGQITVSGGDADVANTPPTESWSAVVSPGGQEKFGSTAGVFSASGPDNTSASASLVLGNGTSAPFVQASANAASAPPGIAASASASVEYFFQITGPANSAVIDISGIASASGTGPTSFGTATGYWGGVNPNGTFLNQNPLASVFATPSVPHPASDAFNVAGSVNVGSSYAIDMSAYVGYTNGTATATFDPAIKIDPSTPDASAYSIVLSPGIEQPASVPEPSTLGLLALGLGELICTRRKLKF